MYTIYFHHSHLRHPSTSPLSYYFSFPTSCALFFKAMSSVNVSCMYIAVGPYTETQAVFQGLYPCRKLPEVVEEADVTSERGFAIYGRTTAHMISQKLWLTICRRPAQDRAGQLLRLDGIRVEKSPLLTEELLVLGSYWERVHFPLFFNPLFLNRAVHVYRYRAIHWNMDNLWEATLLKKTDLFLLYQLWSVSRYSARGWGLLSHNPSQSMLEYWLIWNHAGSTDQESESRENTDLAEKKIVFFC